LLDEGLKQTTAIIAIAPDTKEDLLKMVEHITERDSSFGGMTLLSDAGHRVIDRYGILNPNGRGLPHPATYVIDRQGIVRWRFVEVDYRQRPTNEQVLEALKGLD